MGNLLSVRVDEFNAKAFVKDIINYCREQLNDRDILWWLEGNESEEILKFNQEIELEEQFLNYIKKNGKKLYVPFFVKKENEIGQAILPVGENLEINEIGIEEKETIGIEIEHLNGNYLIKSIHFKNDENKKINLNEKIKAKSGMINFVNQYVVA